MPAKNDYLVIFLLLDVCFCMFSIHTVSSLRKRPSDSVYKMSLILFVWKKYGIFLHVLHHCCNWICMDRSLLMEHCCRIGDWAFCEDTLIY